MAFLDPLQDVDFDSLVNKLNDCTECLKSLETTVGYTHNY